MQQLKDKGYAYMQIAVDNQLQKLLYDEMMLVVHSPNNINDSGSHLIMQVGWRPLHCP